MEAASTECALEGIVITIECGFVSPGPEVNGISDRRNVFGSLTCLTGKWAFPVPPWTGEEYHLGNKVGSGGFGSICASGLPVRAHEKLAQTLRHVIADCAASPVASTLLEGLVAITICSKETDDHFSLMRRRFAVQEHCFGGILGTRSEGNNVVVGDVVCRNASFFHADEAKNIATNEKVAVKCLRGALRQCFPREWGREALLQAASLLQLGSVSRLDIELQHGDGAAPLIMHPLRLRFPCA